MSIAHDHYPTYRHQPQVATPFQNWHGGLSYKPYRYARVIDKQDNFGWKWLQSLPINEVRPHPVSLIHSQDHPTPVLTTRENDYIHNLALGAHVPDGVIKSVMMSLLQSGLVDRATAEHVLGTIVDQYHLPNSTSPQALAEAKDIALRAATAAMAERAAWLADHYYGSRDASTTSGEGSLYHAINSASDSMSKQSIVNAIIAGIGASQVADRQGRVHRIQDFGDAIFNYRKIKPQRPGDKDVIVASAVAGMELTRANGPVRLSDGRTVLASVTPPDEAVVKGILKHPAYLAAPTDDDRTRIMFRGTVAADLKCELNDDGTYKPQCKLTPDDEAKLLERERLHVERSHDIRDTATKYGFSAAHKPEEPKVDHKPDPAKGGNGAKKGNDASLKAPAAPIV